MRIRSRLVSLFLFFCLLLIAGKIATGGYEFLLIDFWFNAGLFMLLFGVLIDQPFYSKDADVLLNGVAATISLLGVSSPGRTVVWWIFLCLSAYLIASSFLIMYLRSMRPLVESGLIASVSRVNRTIGNPKALFSALFLWGTIQQFGVNGFTSSILFLYWALFLAFDFTGLSKLLETLLYKVATEKSVSVGIVTGVSEPGILNVELFGKDGPKKGERLTVGPMANEIVAQGILIDDRSMVGKRVGKIMLESTEGKWVPAITNPDSKLNIFHSDSARQDALGEKRKNVFITHPHRSGNSTNF